MRKLQPIGFFDSGSGGISVLAAFRSVMPQEDYLYFGDHANLPYGDKTPEKIRELAVGACDRLARSGIKALVVACNTASTAALDILSERYPFPVLGIEPPLALAAQLPGSGQILVMATPATLASARFQALALPYGRRFIPLPCPGLAERIEAGDPADQAAYLRGLFRPIDREGIAAIALGCTHYPLIRPLIARAFGKAVPILDSYLQSAQTLMAELQKAGLLSGRTAMGQVRLTSSLETETKQRLERFLRQQSGAIS